MGRFLFIKEERHPDRVALAVRLLCSSALANSAVPAVTALRSLCAHLGTLAIGLARADTVLLVAGALRLTEMLALLARSEFGDAEAVCIRADFNIDRARHRRVGLGFGLKADTENENGKGEGLHLGSFFVCYIVPY